MLPYRKELRLKLSATVGRWALKFLYGTNRWLIEGGEEIDTLRAQGKSIIFAIWHGNLLPGYLYVANKNPYGLAGTHADAEIISRIAVKIGYKTIRGSSKEGGREAFAKIVDVLKKEPGALVFITPDGPKGPPKELKPGTVKAAQKTGAVILPCGSFTSKHWAFKNWDTFYVAKPFGTIHLLIGQPLFFSANDNFEDCSLRVKSELDRLENEAIKRATNE